MTATLEQLEKAIPHLPARDQEFARSLVKGWKRYGSLTPKQAPWADKLIVRVSQPELPGVEASPPTGDMTGVLALFDRAKKHLKFPAIVLSVPGFDTVRITVAGNRARVPGSINVTSYEKRGHDNRRLWYGRVHVDGRYESTARVQASVDVIAQRLAEFATNPVWVAGEHGRLTGRCCFCNTALKDERSTGVGYGPVCADHYGLPWGDRPVQFGEKA